MHGDGGSPSQSDADGAAAGPSAPGDGMAAAGGAAASGGKAASGGTTENGLPGGRATTSPGGASGQATGGGPSRKPCGMLIDDMEDGTGRICTGAGRVGVWYAYNDRLGVAVPPATPPGVPISPFAIDNGVGGSQRAMYGAYRYPQPVPSPSPPGMWGAGLGFDLAFDGNRYGTFDAREMTGISFLVRSTLPKTYFFRVNTVESTPIAYGGTCPTEWCGAFQRVFQAGPEWMRQTVRFDELHFWVQAPGAQLTFRPDQLTNVQFLLTRYPTDSSDSELWLDDVAFFR
jgi:hypothetical protein